MIDIAGVTVAKPASVKVGSFDITKASRTASGKMVMDIIATKRRVEAAWKMLPDAELKTILDTITAHKPFFSLTFPAPGGEETITCYAGDINTSLWHTIGGVRYWDEVSIPFIEQ